MTKPQSEIAFEWSWSKPILDWLLQQWLEKEIWLNSGPQEGSVKSILAILRFTHAFHSGHVPWPGYGRQWSSWNLRRLTHFYLKVWYAKTSDFHRESIRLSLVIFPLNYVVIKYQYLVILFFLDIWESKFPSPFAVRQESVTTNGQWNISRTDMCPSEMEAGNKPLHNFLVFPLSSWAESMESVRWDNRATIAWITESSHGGQLPRGMTQHITDFAGASNKPYMFSCWDLGTMHYNIITYSA